MQPTYTDWTLVSLSPLGRTGLAVAVALTLLAALWVVFSYRRVRRPGILIATRLLGALLVLGFLIEPALQLRVVRRIKNRLAIVVDRSRSMSLATEAGPSRYDTVLALFEGNKEGLAELGESHDVDLFDLDAPLSQAALALPPVAENSDLVTALERARDSGGGKPLAGIVLLSDGSDTAELETPETRELSVQAVLRLGRLGVPVNTIYAGGSGFRDIALTDVHGDEFAFVHNTFEIEVVIEDVGFTGLALPLTLKRDGEIVAQQTVALAKEGRTRVTLKSKPDKIGEYVYSVSVPVLAGEAVASNNERSFVLSVIRDKIRVLQVAGHPSWDERFLRQHLKENPNVDLISFFILRTPTDMTGASENELSLIPFPVEKLFTSELRSFDVVIFQDFDYRPYHMEHYLPNIRAAVRDAGLGFVMVGGTDSFGATYLGTDLEDVLPLIPEAGGIRDRTITPSLTAAGRSHPVTDLTRGVASNDAAWRQLGAWTSVNRTAGLAANATALVVDSRESGADGQPVPLVAVMDAGQGRTMAIASDSMWRWRFAPGDDGGASERAYHRFWSNALRWLVRDPEHSRVRVAPERRRFEVGTPADVTVTVLGQDYQPIPAAHVRLALELAGSGVVRMDDVVTGEGGLVRMRYPTLIGGAYTVRADASGAAGKIGDGVGVFVVETRSLEQTRGAPRPDLLAAIAERTGGKHPSADDGPWSKLELVNPEVVEVDRRRNVEIWDNAWALVAALALLATDWAVRRRRGYV